MTGTMVVEQAEDATSVWECSWVALGWLQPSAMLNNLKARVLIIKIICRVNNTLTSSETIENVNRNIEIVTAKELFDESLIMGIEA